MDEEINQKQIPHYGQQGYDTSSYLDHVIDNIGRHVEHITEYPEHDTAESECAHATTNVTTAAAEKAQLITVSLQVQRCF